MQVDTAAVHTNVKPLEKQHTKPSRRQHNILFLQMPALNRTVVVKVCTVLIESAWVCVIAPIAHSVKMMKTGPFFSFFPPFLFFCDIWLFLYLPLCVLFAKWKCCLALTVILWNNIAGCNNILRELCCYSWKCVFCTSLGNMSKFFASLNVELCFSVILIMLKQQHVATENLSNFQYILNIFIYFLQLKMLLPSVYVKKKCLEL